MELSIPQDNPQGILHSYVKVNGEEVRMWPRNMECETLGDPRIFGAVFPDSDSLRDAMIQSVLKSNESEKHNVRGNGGNKIRAKETWQSPVGRYLTLRALLMFCQTTGSHTAYTVDRWANVSLTGDYSAPHAHYESQAAVVYFLDLGDEDPDTTLSGNFELMDSRIPWCCTTESDCPTRSLIPTIRPGAMVLFPASFLHFVHPYTGKRPRITLAWNISAGGEPSGHEDRMAVHVKGEVTR
jgi:hypothetical protein